MSALEIERPLAAPAATANTVFTFALQPLTDYAETCRVEDAFSREEVARILEVACSFDAEDATLGGDRSIDLTHRRSRVRWANVRPDTMWIFQRLGDILWGVNQARYKFDLYGFHEGLQVAEYGPGAFFNWHKDHGPGPHSTRKLSVTVQLSDESEYEGGTMEFLHSTKVEQASRKMGTAIIFPAYVMHRVTEVTAGLRRSVVAWIAGPPFR